MVVGTPAGPFHLQQTEDLRELAELLGRLSAVNVEELAIVGIS